MLPNFLGLGPARCGTTSIYEVLRQHPDVYLPRQKETDFFSTYPSNFPIAYYERLFFDGYAGQSAVGEISPSYLHSKEAVGRIYDGLGAGTKLLVFLRNPVDRMLSEYRFFLRGLAQTHAFEDYLTGEPGSARADPDGQIGHSLYAEAISRYVERFGRHAIFPIVFEQDIDRGQPELLERFCRFLGIPHRPQEIPAHSNPTPRFQATYFKHAATIPMPGAKSQTKKVPADTLVVLNDVLPNWSYFLHRPSSHALAAAKLLNQHRSFKLTAEMRADLMRRYFEVDVRRTEDLLQIDLSHWRQATQAERIADRPPKDLFKKKKITLAKKLKKLASSAIRLRV